WRGVEPVGLRPARRVDRRGPPRPAGVGCRLAQGCALAQEARARRPRGGGGSHRGATLRDAPGTRPQLESLSRKQEVEINICSWSGNSSLTAIHLKFIRSCSPSWQNLHDISRFFLAFAEPLHRLGRVYDVFSSSPSTCACSFAM